ncbi:cytosol aminopeptidase-like [Sphaerodactylus townsendi]|uniref:cytosol aminopeptidase-like n=1 Tax=Sphaerodactylus townsendi TaxID=933632 RepID=UPI0020275C7D|nr:cytosol aminopeptidase-like [Sphaerodactylus townsendi]
MRSFLSVAKGSEEPPVFLEIHYRGSNNSQEPPLVFVGKGITFDSGGISIKPSANMDAMRADMGGAATICSAIVTAAQLKLPINLIGLAPLCENMPSGKANKPGDVVRAKSGKTIQIDNTDAEGRLILADALFYAHSFNPRAIVDAATLTGAMDVALGSAATGVFTNSQKLWNQLFEVSHGTSNNGLACKGREGLLDGRR